MGLAQKAPFEGANKVSLYELTTTGLFDTSIMDFDRNIDSSRTGHPAKNKCKIVLTNKIYNETFLNFLASYLPDKEIVETVLTYEDNQQETIVSGVTTAKTFGVIYYEGKVGTKRSVVYGRGTLSGATGDSKMVASNIGDIPVEITLINGLPVNVPAATFDTNLITTTTAQTATTDEYGKLVVLTAP